MTVWVQGGSANGLTVINETVPGLAPGERAVIAVTPGGSQLPGKAVATSAFPIRGDKALANAECYRRDVGAIEVTEPVEVLDADGFGTQELRAYAVPLASIRAWATTPLRPSNHPKP